ncbi:hypothetical protein [Ramlibacter humi]|uniref:HEAT repeat domain-containing protein n=1 Tax=Ramlibacter humi TaxID=2530451 RepID=A0A4Z0BAU5_9BURK|nr:hypothetical protein [Ramlibacter humi]TFY96166.1 hypothetical protein EZ216_21110 [Ramlibacter humi]
MLVKSAARAHMNRSPVPEPHADFKTLTKVELHGLADELLACDTAAVERCVNFVLADTKGLWHGRARALMCRRLKHCDLGRTHRTALVDCITQRLRLGLFSEQFKDQLRLAMHLDLEKTLLACRQIAQSDKPYVRRYAQWALSLHAPEDMS